MNILSYYSSLLTRAPLATKSITGGDFNSNIIGFVFTLGDVIVQKMEREFDKKDNKIPKAYDWKRLGCAWLMGNVFMMPLFHYQFTYVLPWVVKRY